MVQLLSSLYEMKILICFLRFKKKTNFAVCTFLFLFFGHLCKWQTDNRQWIIINKDYLHMLCLNINKEDIK